MKRFLLLILLFLLASPAGTSPANAQTNAEVVDLRVEYRFAESITFHGRLAHPDTIREANLLFQAEGETQTHVFKMAAAADGKFAHPVDIRSFSLPPFALVHFWFRLTFTNGSSYITPANAFHYEDNRFSWQVLDSPTVRVHWYKGDLAFGQLAMDIAQQGLQTGQNLVAGSLTEPLDVYIYSNSADLQSALDISGQSWVAGHASVESGVALVSIAPGLEQRLEMDRQIPHELMHLYIYGLVGEKYRYLPAWFAEGLASIAESVRNPDYARIIETASAEGSLFPMSSLCNAFPDTASGRFQAYAQSQAFVRYLWETQGASGIKTLLTLYADGLNCDQGLQRAFNLSLAQAETAWRSDTLGENRLTTILREVGLYLLLFLGFILVALWRLIPMGRKASHGKSSKSR